MSNQSAAKLFPGRRCVRSNCKRTPAYSRLENTHGKVKERNYCPDHWKSDVENKQAFRQQVIRWEKSLAAVAKKPKRRVKVKR